MSISPMPVNGLPGITRNLAGDLVLASRMITAARDYTDMAMGVLYTIGQRMTAVSITLLQAAEGGALSRSVAALVTVEGGFPTDPQPRADLLPTPEQIETLRRGLPITLEVQQASDLTQQELAPLNINWISSFALRTDDQILGTLDILHTQPCDLTTEEIDAFMMLADQIGVTLQNHRLLREAQLSASELSKQVRLLQIINQLATTISSTQDEKTLMDTSCRALVEATGLDHSSIALITAAGTAAQVLSEYPMKGTVGVQLPLADNTVYDIVRETHQPLVIADINTDTHLPAASQHLLQRMGVHAMMVIPLFASDRLVGSIGLDVYTADKPITPDIVDTALAVAAQIGLGIQNSRFLAEAQRRAEQLQRITAFSQSVQATLDLPTIFSNMLAESALMLTQEQMNISLYDANQDALRVVAEHSGGQTQVNPDSGNFIPISGHIATAWNNRELLHIPDLYKLRDHADTESDIRAWMVAPILVRGRMLGLVSVGSVRAYAYTDTDVALFQQMVTQLAVAIENVEAYTQSQRMVKNESLLNSISTQLQNQMNIERMMDITARELGKALGARRARIRFGSPDGSS